MEYSKFKNDIEFKTYLKNNKLRIKDYFEKESPKFDLLTGEKIRFKDRKSYLITDFSNKRNLVNWLKAQSEKDRFDYLTKKILERKRDKQLTYFPSQVELRSIKQIPTLNHLIEMVNYNKLCGATSLKPRYDYTKTFNFRQIQSDLIILRDTREQTPLRFPKFKIIESKLDYGDYTAASDWFDSIYIERKSLQDLIGTMSKGFERFCREIIRAESMGAYIVVLVEDGFKDFESFEYTRQGRYTNCSYEYIAHQIKKIMQSYGNIQFVFAGSKDKSADLLIKFLKAGKNIKQLDLQYLVDIKCL